MTTKRILNVGQCMADSGSIERTFFRAFGAEVVSAHLGKEAVTLLSERHFDLVLVNRIFDADGGSGLDLIRRLRGDEKLKAVPVMLVSNFPDAQAQAVAAGALQGFGKAALSQTETLANVGRALGVKGE